MDRQRLGLIAEVGRQPQVSVRAPSLINSPPLLLVKVGLPVLSPCPLASDILAPVLGSTTRFSPCRRHPPLPRQDGNALSSEGVCVRVGVSEGACYLEGDEAGNEERVALKGRKGGRKGIGDGREIQGEKSTQGEKNRDELIRPWRVRQIGTARGRNGAIGGARRRRAQMYYVHPLSGRCKSNVTAGRWACT